jgi:acetolactate synthase-1/3 small subunit
MLGILSTKYFARKATASLTSRFMSYAKVSSRAAEKEHEVKWTKRKRMILPSLIDIPSPTVEEAVDNILYNNPVTSPTKIKKHTLNCLVSNEPVSFNL